MDRLPTSVDRWIDWSFVSRRWVGLSKDETGDYLLSPMDGWRFIAFTKRRSGEIAFILGGVESKTCST